MENNNTEQTAIATVMRDTLTNFYHPIAFAEIFSQLVLIAAREHMPISLVMVDIDNFKAIYANLGAKQSEQILISTANTLKGIARDSDIIGKFGDDEFILLMFNTNHKEAQRASERLREAVEEQVFANQEPVTVSVGVTTFGEKSIAGIDLTATEIYGEMLHSVNMALSRAKENGRNQVCF